MTEHQPEASLPSAAAIRAYLDTSGWTRHPGPSWSRDGRCVDAPDWLAPDLIEEVLAVIAHTEGRGAADVTASVEALAAASRPAKECGCSRFQPCAAHMAAPAPVLAGVTRWRGKQPVVVEAIQWTGSNLDAIRVFAGEDGTSCPAGGDLAVWNNRDRDWKPVPFGHMVVRGPLGMLSEDFFPLPPDLFATAYVPAPEPLAELLLAEALERAEAAEARLLEYENAVTWGTSCLSCSRVLDSAYAETVRREAAEARLARITAHCRDRMNSPGRSGMTRAAAGIILGIAEGSDGETRDG